MLKVGSVSVPNSKDNGAEYRIRDRKMIISTILPIFDKYTLLTSKQFNYKVFREAILVYDNEALSFEEKDKKLSSLKSLSLPLDYKSSAWPVDNQFIINPNEACRIMSKE